MIDEKKLLNRLNEIRDFKIAKAKAYSVEHPFYNVYSSEVAVVNEIIEWIELGCPDDE